MSSAALAVRPRVSRVRLQVDGQARQVGTLDERPDAFRHGEVQRACFAHEVEHPHDG